MKIANPATGEVIAEVPEDSARDVASRLERARAAQPAWAGLGFIERAAVVRRFRELLAQRREELAATLTAEVGKPLTQARGELKGTLARIDFFLEATPRVPREETVHSRPGLEEAITLEPLGVVANVSAWNYPYFVGSNVFLPALLTGNAVLYKPSEFATLSGRAIGQLLHEAGVPADVFAVVVGGAETGAALVAQPVDGLFFTGSYATGRRIAEALAGRMVRMQLELGGKDPVYVCDDVDVEKAAHSAAEGAFYNTGQSCCAVERVYVHEAVHDRFLEAFLETVKSFPVGDPMDERTFIGPVTRPAQVPLLQRQVADAQEKGARLLLGGRRIDRPGSWFEPTVLAEVDHSMDVMRDESFGPVIGVQRAAGDEVAVKLMNDTEYGLTAGVYSQDRARARGILARVNTGSVYWNCCDRVSPRLPWTGRRHSGIGSTLGLEGIRAFLQPKAWHLREALG
jgi:acyl-CoA reductase-like NAD-dependent aldehyde dehydrogenase